MQRYVCIHGHFYQPPRENPWLDTVETQDSAFPYHDWNERVSAECYAPNAAARILDREGFIVKIVNNYERISFNFGPTLLSWMESKEPEVYNAILEADRRSIRRFSGHGNALAQVYNHVIMPLAHERDKETQVVWGIRDFVHRFGRMPEGMWLAETAVDTPTLETLAGHGIKFTVLAPSQAKRTRPAGGDWSKELNGSVDTTVSYVVNLPSGRNISVFFYDGALSQAVAFDRLLGDGDRFASRLMEAAMHPAEGVRLAHIATDGETYGHHHRFGDMALGYALDHIERAGIAQITNYGEFLEKYPPQFEAEIVENSSWSCAHGVERWRSNCGCNTGGNPGWNQLWRTPLRDSLEWLRGQLATVFEREAAGLLPDPWGARNDYIDVLLERSTESREAFLRSHLLPGADASKALRLLEVQRQAVLMFASCAWFFDDLAGIETVQAMLHAGRAIQLVEHLTGAQIEGGFLKLLAEGSSNIRDQGSGAEIFVRQAESFKVELIDVGAHYAASSLFREYGESDLIGPFKVDRIDHSVIESGRNKLVQGAITVESEYTLEAASFSFAALHLGDQNLAGGIVDLPEGAARVVDADMGRAFSLGDMTGTLRLIDSQFPEKHFSLRSLFRDEQRRIVELLLQPVLEDTKQIYRRIYSDYESLIRFLASVEYRVPNRLRVAGQITLDLDLQQALAEPEVDGDLVRSLLDQARLAGISLDDQRTGLVFQRTLDALAAAVEANPADEAAISRLYNAVSLLPLLGFRVDLWQTQNRFYYAVRKVLSDPLRFSARSAEWQQKLEALGQAVRVRVSA